MDRMCHSSEESLFEGKKKHLTRTVSWVAQFPKLGKFEKGEFVLFLRKSSVSTVPPRVPAPSR